MVRQTLKILQQMLQDLYSVSDHFGKLYIKVSRLLLLMKVLCLCPFRVQHQRRAGQGRFFEGLQNYMQNENEGNENKIMPGDLNCTMDKQTGMVKIKHQDFICAVPIMTCQNSLWIMGLRIYGEGRTQIPLSSPAMIGSLPRIQDRQGLY